MWYGKNDKGSDHVIIITSQGRTQRYVRTYGLWNISDTEFVTDEEYHQMRREHRPHVQKSADIDNLKSELEKHFDELLNK